MRFAYLLSHIFALGLHHGASELGRRSNSWVQAVRGCWWRWRYVSAIASGAIETPFVRSLMGDEAFEAAKAAGGLLAPEAIADTYFHLHQQPRTAWTHELDLRPASEAPWWSPRAKV